MTESNEQPVELTVLQHWMRVATADEAEQLAQLAGTSRDYLWQLGSGARQCSAKLAGRLERAAARIKARSPRGALLPGLLRPALSADCRECSYARECLGEAVIASAFPVLAEDIPGRAVRERPADHDAAADGGAGGAA